MLKLVKSEEQYYPQPVEMMEEWTASGEKKVLMVCNQTNIASAKSILNNGGILENEIEVDGVTEQRYWIAMS